MMVIIFYAHIRVDFPLYKVYFTIGFILFNLNYNV